MRQLKLSKSFDSPPKKLAEQLGSHMKPVLPPIENAKDQEALENIKKFIEKEKIKTKCKKDIYDQKRFSIYR